MNFSLLLDLFLPNRCMGCNQIIDSSQVLCPMCLSGVSFHREPEMKDEILRQKLSLLFCVENVFVLLRYQKKGLSQKIVHSLKYGDRPMIGGVLANWLLEQQQDICAGIDQMVTVPLHPRKQKKRGYNQLHSFAESLSYAWGVAHDPFALKREKHQSSQARKNKRQRTSRGSVFRLQNTRENIHYLLIDDVCTTGNTLAECALELLKNKGARVSVLLISSQDTL